MKFCKVSWNSFSDGCWRFRFPLLNYFPFQEVHPLTFIIFKTKFKINRPSEFQQITLCCLNFQQRLHKPASKICWLHCFQHFTYCSELFWLLCHKSTKYCFSPKCKYVMQTGNSRLPKSATHSYVLRSRLLNKFERASLSKHSFKRSIMSKFLLSWLNPVQNSKLQN